MLENYPDILRVKDICTILQINPKTVYRLADEGVLSSRKIGRTIYITKESVLRLFDPEGQEKDPASPKYPDF